MSLCGAVCTRAQPKQQLRVHLFIQLFSGSFIHSLGQQPAAIKNDKSRAEQCNAGRSWAALPAIKSAQQSRARRWSCVFASVGSARARTRTRTGSNSPNNCKSKYCTCTQLSAQSDGVKKQHKTNRAKVAKAKERHSIH